MSHDPLESDPAWEAHGEAPIEDEDEAVDGVPVLEGPPRIVQWQTDTGAGQIERRTPAAMIPAVQAAAVAAGGFVAGAAVLGLVHRHQQRTGALAQGRRAGKEIARRSSRKRNTPAAEVLQVMSSRTLLVDVHLLGVPGSDR